MATTVSRTEGREQHLFVQYLPLLFAGGRPIERQGAASANQHRAHLRAAAASQRSSLAPAAHSDVKDLRWEGWVAKAGSGPTMQCMPARGAAIRAASSLHFMCACAHRPPKPRAVCSRPLLPGHQDVVNHCEQP